MLIIDQDGDYTLLQTSQASVSASTMLLDSISISHIQFVPHPLWLTPRSTVHMIDIRFLFIGVSPVTESISEYATVMQLHILP